MQELKFNYETELDQLDLDTVEKGHISYETENGIICNYQLFYMVAKDSNDNLIGVLAAYTAFGEIYIDDLWVKPSYRMQGVGRRLLIELENHFRGKGYNNINLVTNDFQAPQFYKNCGYTVEFVRENKINPKLTKTFFVKYFEDEEQYQGILKK